MDILESFINKEVKLVYKDGFDHNGNEFVKTIICKPLRHDGAFAEFELLKNGSKTMIALTEIVRITERLQN